MTIKGNKYFVGENPVGYGLPERAGFFMKKGYRQEVDSCKGKTDNRYWSSSENSNNPANNAYNLNMRNGNMNNDNKNNDNAVRACLAFTLRPAKQNGHVYYR